MKQKRMRQREHWRDKCFTAAATSNPPPPHMEWISGEFRECAPMPLPSLTVKAEIMGESLNALGRKSRVQKSSKLSVYADSCCQTCTAGPDLIATLGCLETVLAPTRHSINGIAESKVRIRGTLPLKISFNNRTTRQLVYISENVKGTFLSERALMDLGLIPINFPEPPYT